MSVISVRMTEAERGMLEEAAGGARISLSDFVRRSALEAAELALIARTEVVIAAEDWAAFEAFAAVPAREVPPLAQLARSRPAWEG